VIARAQRLGEDRRGGEQGEEGEERADHGSALSMGWLARRNLFVTGGFRRETEAFRRDRAPAKAGAQSRERIA
jgi:hypothetical protein